jgi:hypothetical protein
MIRRPGKALLALVCALMCVVAVPAAASAKKATVGISDQTTGFFSDPRFLSLHIHEARLVVPWDVASAGYERGMLNYTAAWIAAAQSAGVKPLISFGDSHHGVPSVHQYVLAVRAFIKRFPTVHQFTAWNEPDFIYLPQIANHPSLAAAYYNQLVFASMGHHNTVLAGDMFMPAPQLGSYLRQYIRYLAVKPAGWALHNYRDVRGRSTAQLTTMERYTKGPIWLDETGGIESRGHWNYPNQSAAAAARDEAWLFTLPKRFPRIAYIFHYQWQQAIGAGWDSGLIDSRGRERPAYNVVKKYIG